LTKDRMHAHMHTAYWRIDVDLGGEKPNLVHMVRHLESSEGKGYSKQQVDTLETEGGYDWNASEFTTLRVTNPRVRNTVGNPIGYHLIPALHGSARHFGPPEKEKAQEKLLPDEAFTRHDFWITLFNPQEMDYLSLPRYVQGGRRLGEDS